MITKQKNLFQELENSDMDYIRRSTEGFFQLARMWLPVLINQLSIPVKTRKQTSRPLVFEKEAANITIDTVIFCFFVEF